MSEQALLFNSEPDDRVQRLRGWIRRQWMFAHIFWPTEKQIIFMADGTQTLCETVIRECADEWDRHCEDQPQ
jgi:hypothetical protein